MRRSLLSALLASGVLVTPLAAMAQEAGPLEPLGMRAGAFLLYPRLNASAQFDSNVYAEPNHENSDLAFVVRPELEARSTWSRHALEALIFAEGGFYLDETSQNYLDFGASVLGRVDISRMQALRIGLRAARLHEDAAAPDRTPGNNSDVTKYLNLVGSLTYRHEFNRFFVQPGITVSRNDYEDVPGFNNDDRDHNRYAFSLRGGVRVSPAIGVFGEGEYRITDYDQTPDDNGVDRESKAWAARVGVEVEMSRLLIGEAAVGIAHHDPDDNALDSTTGFNAVVNLTWTPTPLTTVAIGALADLQETTVTFGGNTASARFRKQVSVSVSHQLRRNVELVGSASYMRDDFEDTARSDDTISLGAGVNYTVNRWLAVGVSYNFQTRSSDDNNAEYDRHVVRGGIRLQR